MIIMVPMRHNDTANARRLMREMRIPVYNLVTAGIDPAQTVPSNPMRLSCLLC